MKKQWYDYLWIFSLTYLILGFFNILSAWLGLICFFVPLIISLSKGTKGYCNRYCAEDSCRTVGRSLWPFSEKGYSQMDEKQMVPLWILIFFFAMFFLMLWNTYLVFSGAQDLNQAVTLLWTFKVPWQWAYHGTIFHTGAAQFAFGFYSVMLTSTVLGLITMILFKPRSWCVCCPMGTMTQLICKAKNQR